MTIKPGYKTSEFWFTLVSFIFSGLYLTGLLDDHAQKEDLIQETTKGLEATILVIGQLTLLFRYIKGRTDLKKAFWTTITEEDQQQKEKSNGPPPKRKKRKNANTKPISK